jgi:hypothetical protein
VTIPQPQPASEPVPHVDRSRALANSIRQHVAQGWRVESQTDTDAILVRGQRCNHVLHLLVSVLTFGIWVIVWIFMAIANAERRMSISVDDFGNTLVTKL